MNIFNFLILFGFAHLVAGSMLKCGEEIIVNRGEKKTLRFWSTDDELLRVEMVPDRGESDASALLAMFKNSYNKGSDIFGSRGEPIRLKSPLSSKNNENESLYRIDEKIIENFNNHFSSKQEPTQYTADNETQTTTSSVSLKEEDSEKNLNSKDEIISQVEVESKLEHEKENTSEIPEKQYDEDNNDVSLKEEDNEKNLNSKDEIISQVEVVSKWEHEKENTSEIPEKQYDEDKDVVSLKNEDNDKKYLDSKDEVISQVEVESKLEHEKENTSEIPEKQYDEDNDVSLKNEDNDKKYLDSKDEVISQVEVESKLEHDEENTSEIPETQYDIKTSTDMNITPEEKMKHEQEQTPHVEKEDISSSELIPAEEIVTEGYEEDLVLDFSYDSDIKESEPSTESEIIENIQEQKYDKTNEATTNYKFAEETITTQDVDKVVTPLPEIDIPINNDLTTIHVTEKITSIYPQEISDSSTDLPLEEKYDGNFGVDISRDPLDEAVVYEDKDITDTTESFEDNTTSYIKENLSTTSELDETTVYQDKDIIDTTESFEDKITSLIKEDPLTTNIPEVESTTLPAISDYKLNDEESIETDKYTDSNYVTPSIEAKIENLEIHTTEPVQEFTTENENIKESSDDINSPETTTEFEALRGDHTEQTLIMIDPTQLVENTTINEMENIPEIYIEEGYLEDIISELKSQEALLKHPSTGDNSQNTGTMNDDNDNESIDLKLSILKNIIKGITSEIEAKEKQKTGIEDNRDHIYIPYGEEEIFTKDEEQNNDKQPTEKVKTGKIHVEESSSLSSLRKHLLEKASKGDASTSNEIILPNLFNSASLVNQQGETNSQNIIEKDNNGADDDEQQLTTAPSVESSTSKISNEYKTEEKKELKNTQSESKKHDTEYPSHEELVIPLNLLKIFSDDNAKKESVNEQKELASSDLKSSVTSLSNDQDNLRKENILSSQETVNKNLKKEGINLEEKITTSSSIIEEQTSTIGTKEEQVQDSRSDNSENDIFGKETGSDKVLSLIKNGEKDIIEFTKHEHEGENSILLPSQLFNSKQETSQTLTATEDDNKVEIKEPGSKVVIIKPDLDILKAKKDTDSLALNTENGSYEVEIESTTTQQSISDEIFEGISEKLRLSDPNSENSITNKSMSEDESEVTTLGQEMAKSTTESYIPFGIAKERNNVETVDEIQNESLNNIEVTHEVETPDSESVANDSISDNEKPSNSATPSADSVKSDTSENAEIEILSALESQDKEAQSYYDEDTFDYDAAYPQNEHFQRKIDTDIHEEKTPQNYLYNHRIEENPLPYVLQTRKGLIEVDPVVTTGIRTGGIQNRRDDSQQTFGKDSPFFIKLPGTPDMVPVFLQYEPVKVKYVNAEKFFKKKPGNAIGKTETKQMINNDVSSTTSKKILKIKNKDKYNPEVGVSGIPNDYLNVDFHLRPDPFYVMDPPNLADKNEENVEEENNEVETVSISVESKLGFNTQQNIPDSMKEDKPVYPGEYFIKNPDNSYSSSDTSSLTNPVFSLGSKVTLPPRESVNLQYTPFPLTTNPPKKQTPENVENEIEVVKISPLPLYSPTTKRSPTLITSDSNSNSTENTPSIEYSPVPSIDYPDSYGPFEFPDIPFIENNEDLLFDDTPESLSAAYPEKAAFITGIKNEKLIDEPQKKNNDFDIVALANFLHQNQKVWSSPKVTPNPETNSWRNPSWDDVIHSAEQPEEPPSDTDKNSGPWVERRSGMGEERFYSAFHSPEEVPGLDPAFFSYRKMPADVKENEPLKDSNLSVEKRSSSDVDGIMRYIENLPLIMQKAVINPKSSIFKHRVKRSAASAGEHVYCEWNVKTEPGLYLLVTFHNLSAPYTVDCYGAYIEVERENNGYDARWCGNRATVPGARPHVIFAKSEVRITLYDNGDAAKTYPTGFEAEIEVIDLFDTEEYRHFIEKKATPKIRRLMEG